MNRIPLFYFPTQNIIIDKQLNYKDLEATAKSLKKDNISTAFYPEKAHIDRSKNELIIEGKFLSYFGKSKSPVTTQKKFSLGWKILSRG